jgi:phenylacetate-CoA ligase
MAKDRAHAPAASELDREELMSRDELEALQLARLQHTVAYAYERVPLYRAKFDAVGVHPGDIRDLGDIAKLPFTTKDDLRDTYPFGMFAVPRSQVARIHASSGTTGKATVVGYTTGDLENWATLVARSLRASGVRPGHLVHNAYGYGLFTGGLGAHAGIERLGATVIPMSGGNTARQVQLIADFQPDAILCTPTYLLTIIDAIRASGLDPRDSSLKVGILGAEPWTNEMRASIEQQLGIDALDIYGLSEVLGPGVGNECIESKDGPHIWEDHFLPEIINSETGATLSDGVEGELVLTTLTKEALPIIRYRTHDLSTLLPGTGRPNMRRIRKITGRNDDMIILRGVNLFPTQIEEIALGIEGLSPHFMLERTREGTMDGLVVHIEAAEGSSTETRAAVAASLGRAIKTHIGSSVGVVIADIGTLPRSEGKLNRIIDHREN